jgi:hypothetical protein
MQREALEKMNRLANEMTAEVTTAVNESGSLCTVLHSFDTFCYKTTAKWHFRMVVETGNHLEST